MLTDERCKFLLKRIKESGEDYLILNKVCKQWNKNIMEQRLKLREIYKQIEKEFDALHTPDRMQQRRINKLKSDIKEIEDTMIEHGCKTIFMMEEDCEDVKELLKHKKK